MFHKGSNRKEEACIQASLALVRHSTSLMLMVGGFFLVGAACKPRQAVSLSASFV